MPTAKLFRHWKLLVALIGHERYRDRRFRLAEQSARFQLAHRARSYGGRFDGSGFLVPFPPGKPTHMACIPPADFNTYAALVEGGRR